MLKFRVAFAVCMGLTILGSQAAAQIKLNPVADAHVRSGIGKDENYGSLKYLYVKNGSASATTSKLYFSFLKFDIGAASQLSPAKLRFTAQLDEAGSISVEALSVNDNSWSESTIRQTNMPARGSHIGTTQVNSKSLQTYEIDLSTYIAEAKMSGKSFVTVALAIPTISKPRLKIFSREASTGMPELVIGGGVVTLPPAPLPSPNPAPAPVPPALPTPPPQTSKSVGIWINSEELALRPMAGTSWNRLLSDANQTCGTPDLTNQDDPTNICILAKALVFARSKQESYRVSVLRALDAIVASGTYNGRALALGRELGTYATAADLIDLKNADPILDTAFRAKLKELRSTFTSGGPSSLIECHEKRPNNWGTHCGATRLAIAVYLGDAVDLARAKTVFQGYLGDRAAYSGFSYGDLSWQCDPAKPVGINPKGCMKNGLIIDGVIPDDQRRSGGFSYPFAKENYVWEALQGVLAQAVILKRAGFDMFGLQDQAILRAMEWVNTQAQFPAAGDDTFIPHLVNFYYGTTFPAPAVSGSGKAYSYTDYTHGF